MVKEVMADAGDQAEPDARSLRGDRAYRGRRRHGCVALWVGQADRRPVYQHHPEVPAIKQSTYMSRQAQVLQ